MSDPKLLFIQTTDVKSGVLPNGNVMLSFGHPHPSLGFNPDLTLAAELTPGEARQLADLLLRMARAAEGGSVRPS